MSDDEWVWELSSTAQDDLNGLSRKEQDRVLDKLDEIVDSPWRDPPDYGEPLKTVRTGRSASVSSGSPWRFAKMSSDSSSRGSNVGAARTLLTTTDEADHRRPF